MRAGDHAHEGEDVFTAIAATRTHDVEEARTEAAAGIDGAQELEAADLDAVLVARRTTAHGPGHAHGKVDGAVIGFNPIARAGEAAVAILAGGPHDGAGGAEVVQAGLGGVAVLADGRGAGGDLAHEALGQEGLAGAFAGDEFLAKVGGTGRQIRCPAKGRRLRRLFCSFPSFAAVAGHIPQNFQQPRDARGRADGKADRAADRLGHGAAVRGAVREEVEEFRSRDKPLEGGDALAEFGGLRAGAATLRQDARETVALPSREHGVIATEPARGFRQGTRGLLEAVALLGEFHELQEDDFLFVGFLELGFGGVGESDRGLGRVDPGDVRTLDFGDADAVRHRGRWVCRGKRFRRRCFQGRQYFPS